MFVCHRVVRDPAALASVAADREVQETFGQEDEELQNIVDEIGNEFAQTAGLGNVM